MNARLHFHGAAREVTGSMHLIEVNGHNVALDCGMFQGRRSEAEQKNRSFPCEPSKIDALILSHAHIDHCGKLPRLVHEGFAGKIHATPATCELAPVMLFDSGKIQQEDAEYWNRKHVHRGQPPIAPLYTIADVDSTVPRFQPHELGQIFEVVPGVRAVFHEAGHMLGSAGVHVFIDSDSKPITITFTGDLGRKFIPILNDPVELPKCDYLISESTYGGRMTESPQDVRQEFADVLNATFARGGKVIIPAFAVGRTQTIVYHYHQLLDNGALRYSAPLVVDSPLAYRATEVYRHHPEAYDQPAGDFNVLTGDILNCKTCEYTQDVQESKALHGRKGPMVIVSASGMCEAGRILHHLKNNITNPNNTILIVGYQAANTLGRRLVEKQKQVKIFGETYDVRAQLKTLNGFSSHANSQELNDAVRDLAPTCKQAFLVHGEPDQSQALATSMQKSGFKNVVIPAPGARFELL